MQRMKKGEYWEQLAQIVDVAAAAAAEQPRPVCHDTEICEGCGYPGHGFVCRGADGRCLRAEIEKIYEKRRGKNNAGNHL